MKRLWIAAGLIVFTVGLCTTGYVVMNRSASKLMQILEEGKEAAEKEDYFAAADLAMSAKQQWNKTKPLLEVFVNHNDLEELNEYLVMIEDTADSGDIEGFNEICKYSADLLTDIIDHEKPTVHSVLQTNK